MSIRLFEAAKHAALYASYRPSIPASVVTAIMDFLKQKPNSSPGSAVDVGCGSGQSTPALADHFASVTGVDISQAQVDEANRANTFKHVAYKVSGAESLPFPASSLQLVMSCQASHWFDMPAFYAETDRILVEGGVVALCGYKVPRITQHSRAEQLTAIVDELYGTHLGDYWDVLRVDVDNGYMGDRFTMPYSETVRQDGHYCDRRVTVEQLVGYMRSWSSYVAYCKRHGGERGQLLLKAFTDRMMSELAVSTGPSDTTVHLRYPYFLVMGRKPLTEP